MLVRARRVVSRLFSDESLTRKASLNSVSALIDYGARVLVALLITPVILTGLGPYAFGMWQILTRTAGYLAPASGRPTEALKWTLASRQSSTDYEEKRQYVGSALVVWLVFLPLVIGLGVVLTWNAPSWFGVPPDLLGAVRVALGLLVVNVAATSLAYIPQSVLQGENLAYKRMGLSAFFVLFGGGLVWLAVYLDTGIAGVAAATLLSTLLSGLVTLAITYRYTSWLGVKFPRLPEIWRFLSLSFWFLVWQVVGLSLVASDVVLLGLFNAVTTAGDYTLTKYAPEAIMTVISIVVAAIIPGLGGIIGASENLRAARIRSELVSLTWLLTTAFCTSVLLWNRVFVTIWVGDNHYLGTTISLLIVIIAMLSALMSTDSSIINLTLDIRRKVIVGVFAVTVSIAIAVLLMSTWDMGVIGLCIGFIVGRAILNIAYMTMAARFLRLPLSGQAKGLLRPGLVTILLFGGAALVDIAQLQTRVLWGPTWAGFLFYAALTFSILLAVGFYGGLSDRQRRRIRERFHELANRPKMAPIENPSS